MKLIFLGPPGSGKGTYSSRVAEQLKIPHISTGDLFRAELKSGSKLGKEAKKYMDKGQLVPDKVTIGMLQERIKKDDCKNGFILDGFPRTIAQAEALDKILKVDRVINIAIPDKVIIRRLTSRRVCKKCGQIFNVLSLKPKKDGICDKCGGELFQRDDDKEETVQNRLVVYVQQTQPLIDYYKAKNLVDDVEWKIELVPKGEIDIPIAVMLDKIMEKISKV